MSIKRIIKRLINRKSYSSLTQEKELALQEQMRIIREQENQKKSIFGNAGGLNQPSDFSRGLGGRAIEDHLINRPKDNP